MVYFIFWMIILALHLRTAALLIVIIAVLFVAPRTQLKSLIFTLCFALLVTHFGTATLNYNEGRLADSLTGFVYHIDGDKADFYYMNQKFRLKSRDLQHVKEGQAVVVQAPFFIDSDTRNQHSFDYARHYQLMGYRAYLGGEIEAAVPSRPDVLTRRLQNSCRQWFSKRFSLLSGEAELLAKALLLGQLDSAHLVQQVKNMGLLHLFVISGFHFSAIAAVLLFFLDRLLKCPYRLALITVTLASGAYFTILQTGYGSQRALFVILLGTLAFTMRRRHDQVQLVLNYAAFKLALKSAVVYELGFQLTVLTTLVVSVLSRQLKRYPALPKSLKNLLISAAVFVMISGCLIYSTGSAPLVGVVLVPLLTPLVSAFIILLVIALFIHLPFYWQPYLELLSRLAGLIMDWINWASALNPLSLTYQPYWALLNVIVLMAIASALLLKNYDWSKMSALAIGCLLLGLMVIQTIDYGLVVKSFALYDGECYLIRAPGAVILYDVGNSDEIVQLLRREGVTAIDLIIISHHHRDHVGALAEIASHFDVAAIVDQIDRRQQLEVGSLTLDLYQSTVISSTQQNDRSIICHLKSASGSMLFTGDIEDRATKWLLTELQQPIDVLKVPHHGSDNHYFREMIEVYQPRLAVIAGGRGKRIDKHEVYQILQHTKTNFYDTMRDGQISISFRDELEVRGCQN